MEEQAAVFIPTVPAHEVLDSICAYLPPEGEAITREDVKRAVVMAQAGHLVYLPKQLKNELRNREMLAKFNGHNAREICAKYGISKMHFYRLLKKDRAKKVACFKRKR